MKKSAIIFLVLLSNYLQADNSYAKKSLNEFLRKYNTRSSTESAKVYKGQMGGYATAGSVTTRNQVFNRKPLIVSPPSYSAGCAGIDLHMGSFSHISKEEMVDALKDIASNAASYAFLLTMKSVSPQAEDCMRWLQEQSNAINSLNINSCQLAEQAVSAYWPENTAAKQHICQSMGNQSGYFADIANGRQKCANNEDPPRNKDQTGDAFVGSYNVAWEVIQKDPFLSTQPQFAELFMSITGTLVIDDEGIPKHYSSKVNDASFMKNLFEGGSLECYKCKAIGGIADPANFFKKSDGCIVIEEGSESFSDKNSFYSEIRGQLERIQECLLENEELLDSEREILFKTSLPIGRILCALTAYHRGRCPVELGNLAEVVTMDILCQYIKDVIRNARFTANSIRIAQFHGQELDNFISELRDVETIVNEYEAKSKRIFDDHFQYSQMLELVEANLRREIGI